MTFTFIFRYVVLLVSLLKRILGDIFRLNGGGLTGGRSEKLGMARAGR